MKLSCLKSNLEEGVNIVEKITNRSSVLSVLNNILAEAVSTGLKLTSTDLEVGIETIIPAKIEEKGKVVLPSKILSGILHNLFEERVEFVQKENKLTLRTNNYNAELNTLSADDFPILPKVDKKMEMAIDPEDLLAAFQQVLPAAATSETKPELTGIYLRSVKPNLKVVATDSFRLAEKKIGRLSLEGEGFSFIIPNRVAGEIVRIIQIKKPEKIYLLANNNQMAVDFGFAKIISRLIEGNYPDYESIIPDNLKHYAVLDNRELIRAIRLVSNLSSKINDVHLAFKKSKKKIVVSSQESDLGTNKTTVSVKEGNFEDTDIIFNHRFLLDGLNQITTEDVNFSFNNEEKPALVTPAGEKDLLYLIMPIKNQ